MRERQHKPVFVVPPGACEEQIPDDSASNTGSCICVSHGLYRGLWVLVSRADLLGIHKD